MILFVFQDKKMTLLKSIQYELHLYYMCQLNHYFNHKIENNH
jgi:hypothetical protein